MNTKYHYMSNKTGEIVPNLRVLLYTIWMDLWKSHFLNISWSYSREGF